MNQVSELQEDIAREMAGLQKEDYLRPGMTFDVFIREYSNLLDQAKEDADILLQAGFDVSKMPKYYGYLEAITLVHDARVVTELDKHEAKEEFDRRMPLVQKDKKLLLAVGKYIVNRTEKQADKKVYEMVRAGSSDMDSLSDNITMVSFIRENKDLAQEVKPGGRIVDETYLGQVEENAVGLLELRGVAIASSDDAKDQIDLQNRLMTLCIRAHREIKLFAEMAFFDETDRYNQFYGSDKLQQKTRKTEDRLEDITEEVTIRIPRPKIQTKI